MPAKKNTAKTKLQNILVVYTGGTFGMRKISKSSSSSDLHLPDLKPTELKRWLKDQVPEMKRIANCDVDILFNLDSCQFQASHWFELAAHLQAKQKNYDGVVILHGTDTLAYTASALSFLLCPTQIPIVITGAQKPLSTLRSDARSNLISALEVAAHAPKALRNRVMVVFHDELFLGSRVRKKSAVDFAAFESPRFPKLASIGSEIQYHEIVRNLPPLTKRKPLLLEFTGTGPQKRLPQILQIQITPQFCANLFTNIFLHHLDGILLTLYTSGTAPTAQTHFIDFLKRTQNNSTPIFAITERENETPSLSTYSAGRELIKHQVIWCKDLTPEAAFVKAWLLRELNQKHTHPEHYRWLQKKFSNSLSDESSVS